MPRAGGRIADRRQFTIAHVGRPAKCGAIQDGREGKVAPSMSASPSVKPLSRFTVLDLTRVRSGPTAVRQLADWGANVIKVEMPKGLEAGEPLGGARNGPDFQNLHRNKRSLTLNLKDPRGVEIFK